MAVVVPVAAVAVAVAVAVVGAVAAAVAAVELAAPAGRVAPLGSNSMGPAIEIAARALAPEPRPLDRAGW